MNKEDLIIGVHGSDNMVGGHYNMLGSFTAGLLKGFKNNGINAHTTLECYEKGLTPHITIGINVTGYESWTEYLKHGIPSIMWSFDSIFAHNFEAMENVSQYPNFVLFGVTPSDQEPLRAYFPNLKYSYMPHATDLELWKKQNTEKEYDIVLFSSIKDYEQMIEELKSEVPESTYKLIMEMYEISSKNHQLSFWEIYQLFKKHRNLNLTKEEYVFLFRKVSYIIMYAKKAEVVQKLSKFNLKIFGDGPWDKYISGNVQHLGPCDMHESINIMNKSKIVLHPHLMQLALGLHERILNASATETFVMSSNAITIQNEFKNSFGYYNDSTYEDLEEKMQYYLTNEEERIANAKNARKIVEEHHTWDVRARQIVSMIQ